MPTGAQASLFVIRAGSANVMLAEGASAD